MSDKERKVGAAPELEPGADATMEQLWDQTTTNMRAVLDGEPKPVFMVVFEGGQGMQILSLIPDDLLFGVGVAITTMLGANALGDKLDGLPAPLAQSMAQAKGLEELHQRLQEQLKAGTTAAKQAAADAGALT